MHFILDSQGAALMDTVNLELLLDRIARRLDSIYDEFQWFKSESFGEQVLNSLTVIEESLENINTNISNLDKSLAEIRSQLNL